VGPVLGSHAPGSGSCIGLKGKATTSEERRRLRKAESREVLQKMRNWLLTTREPKTTSLGGAIRCTVQICSRLTAFVDAPELWLDNRRH